MKKTKRHIPLKIILIIAIVLSLVGCIGVIMGTYYLQRYTDPDVSNIIREPSSYNRETKIISYAGDDTEPTVELLRGGAKCIPVEYGDVPEYLINAFIAIEDKRFREHKGVDLFRSAEAGLNYFLHFKSGFGASTITQQLIKNATGDDEATPERKLREIFEAYSLEKNTDKTQIMENYLNIINLSMGCRGVGSAARRFFGKTVDQLTLAECASIAAITNNPAKYNPITKPENNRARRDMILSEMLKQKYITDEEYGEAVKAPVDTSAGIEEKSEGVNSWYTDMVINDVINDLCAEYGYTVAHASDLVYNGGLEIYTAQNVNIQHILENYFADTGNFPTGVNGMPQAAMIVIDPTNGDILGTVGGVGEKSGDRVQDHANSALHSPGSAIKPLSVYAPALERGLIGWSTLYEDTPVKTLEQGRGRERLWPKNADGIYRGAIDIDEALSNSVNTVAVKVLDDLGIENSFSFLTDKLNMKSLISEDTAKMGKISDKNQVSLALGQLCYGLTVREITAAYSIFENGEYRKPRSYYRVLDQNGDVLLNNGEKSESVLSRENAEIMTKLLEDVVDNGTGRGIKLDKRISCAGKTGTTQDNCDRWFVGYTPYYLAGVWMGYEYPAPLKGIKGNPCVGIWDKVMTELHRDKPDAVFPTDNIIKVTYCESSGKLPGAECEKSGKLKNGWFTPENCPGGQCGVHTDR